MDGRNFTPVDKNIAKLGVVKDDEEGSLNPYVLAIAGCYPTDGSYPYRCKPLEYDLYNGVTQDLWYKGRVVAKGASQLDAMQLLLRTDLRSLLPGDAIPQHPEGIGPG